MKLLPSKYNYTYKINSKYTLINNFLTGALDIIESSIWELMLGKRADAIGPGPLSNLVERGYLYSSLDKEVKLFRKLYRNLLKKSTDRPIKYVFCPTYLCNLRCVYCFEKELPSNPNKFMSDSMFDSATEAIEEISKKNSIKVKNIELFGGEPLLLKTKDLVNKILKFAEGKDAAITIVTNGIMVKDFIDILKPVKTNIEMLQITIDGPDFIHNTRRKYPSGKGSFTDIAESVDVLLNCNINTNIRVNIDNENIKYLPQLYEYICLKKWINHPNFKIKPSLVTDHSTTEYNDPIIPEDILLKKLIKVYDKYPKLEQLFGFYSFRPLRHIIDILHGAPNVSPRYLNCESNLLELYIFCPDGYIYACPESIGNKNIAIGKFYPELEFYKDKMDLWKERNILIMEKCIGCKFAPLCGGGCPYSSIQIFNGSKEPVCERFQEVLDTFLKYRGESVLEKFIEIK